MFLYDLTIRGDGIATMTYVGLSVHQLRFVLSRRPVGAEVVLRPRDASKPTHKAGGRWL